MGASLLFSGALAGRQTYSMTYNGMEISVVIKELLWIDRKLNFNSSALRSKQDDAITVTTNWAGAIQESPIAGDSHSIAADWRVNGIYPPPGIGLPTGSDEYLLVEWVSLGGDCGATFQAGTGQTLTQGGGLQQFAC